MSSFIFHTTHTEFLFSSLSCFLRYASKLSTCCTLPSFTTQASFATDCTKNWSCDTQITAPSKFLTLSARAATLSKSRLFVCFVKESNRISFQGRMRRVRSINISAYRLYVPVRRARGRAAEQKIQQQ